MEHHRHPARPVETWLAAEQQSDETAADAALQDLIRVLPGAAPPAGFATQRRVNNDPQFQLAE